MTITFSVIVDANNSSKALSSVKRQVYKDYELLVTGNNSAEGLIEARNKAILESKGKLIALIDRKDEWKDNYLQVMAQTLNDHPHALLAYCYYETLSPRTSKHFEVRTKPVQKDLVEALLKENFIHTISSVIFRRSIIDRVGLFDETSLFEGENINREFYLRIFHLTKPVLVPRCLVKKGSNITNPIRHQSSIDLDNFLTEQQRQQFEQIDFTQKVIKKNLVQKRFDSSIKSKVKLKPKFALVSDTQSNYYPRLKYLETPSLLSESSTPRSSKLISLVTTVYNRENYLPETIESILCQTFTDFELVIWDDGSTDRSLVIANKYASNDSRIKVFSDDNQGQGKALVKAVRETRGEYVGTVDSDDLLHPEALAKTWAVLENSDAGVVYTDHFKIDAQGAERGLGKRCTIPYSPERLLIDFMTFHFRLIRYDIYHKVGGFDSSLSSAEDYDLCLRLSEVTKIEHLAEPLYYYRFHDNSLSTTQQLTQTKYSAISINRAINRRDLSQKVRLKLDLKPKYHFQRQTKVANKIFGIGLSKTGTTSLNNALCLLGIPSVHLPLSIDQVKKFDGATDLPIAVAYKKLDLLYPGSKFILTVREPDAWLSSSQKHQQKVIEVFNGRVSDWIRDLYVQCYGQWDFDSSLWLSAYERHLQSILNHFRGREKDLLILNICQGQGWKELCDFLSCSVPNVPFPHQNKTQKSALQVQVSH